MPSMIDLFSGCGGFSAGFVLFNDNPQWQVLLGIDNNADAVASFNGNFGDGICKKRNLNSARPRDYLSRLGLIPGQLDLLHASPPCEYYSINNRKNGNHNDTRYKVALHWTRVFRPKITTIENVHALGDAHDRHIRRTLQGLGYRVYRFKLDAADFGVPQHRKRLFYFGYLRELGIRHFRLTFTHDDPHNLHDGRLPWVTTGEAIRDLPARLAGNGPASFISNIPQNSAHLSEYARLMRPERGQMITDHDARPINALALERIQHLRPGEAIEHLPANLRPQDGFRGAYGRLHPRRPSKTITTGIRGPSHGPYCHYSQERLITFREAARLQSFPDSFTFIGGRTAKATQIGNAVPPLLARVFRQISEQILRNAPVI